VKEKIVIPVSERGIEARLINWGLCQRGRGGGTMRARETRSGYGGGGYRCMTDVVCTIMRDAAKAPRAGATQSPLDFGDSQIINDAWQRLPVRPRLLLRDFYALGRAVNVICRELNIKHWPAIHWQRELMAAQEAIEDIVDGGN
jgi:hypothetical protein